MAESKSYGRTKYWAICMGAILVMAYALVQPIPSNAKVPEVHDCALRGDSPPGDRISMNTVLGFADKIAKTVHVEKQVFDCFTGADNLAVIVDVTIVAEIYEDMERQSVIAKQAEVLTCVKDEPRAKVLGCDASVPPTTPVDVGDECFELIISDPQEMNSVAGFKKNTIVKTIEAQKEVFLCTLSGDVLNKVDIVIFAEIWENLELLPSNPVLKKTFEEFCCVIKISKATVESCTFSNIP